MSHDIVSSLKSGPQTPPKRGLPAAFRVASALPPKLNTLAIAVSRSGTPKKTRNPVGARVWAAFAAFRPSASDQSPRIGLSFAVREDLPRCGAKAGSAHFFVLAAPASPSPDNRRQERGRSRVFLTSRAAPLQIVESKWSGL